MATDSARALFERELETALQHLYDPAVLRQSPLMRLFDLDGHTDALLALQRLLNDAIASLKPGEHVPAQSNAWRVYRTLAYRYTEQYTQQEVASDLGLSVRQLRRVENSALTVLADCLWARYGLDERAQLLALASTEPPPSSPHGAITPSQQQELDWLEKTVICQRVETAEMIASALQIADPLLAGAGLKVCNAVSEGAPAMLVKPAAMRQALLDILSLAARCAPGGQLDLAMEDGTDDFCLRLRVAAAAGQAPAGSLGAEELDLVRKLLTISGGLLRFEPGEGESAPLILDIITPIAEQVPVLVIDDNEDTIRLLQRYLANTRYRFVGVSDPSQALALEGGLTPQIIVLDVMMPGVDGWEILGQLRAHPATRDVPVIVCTILPQEQMALALGAAAFLRKPISRADLLQALDQQLAPTGQAPC
jgi:CheY-like chemotaxis protein/transcriptional regulator with XRE-family HTH domain